MGNNLDLAIAGLGDDDVFTEVADTALDLDAVVEELLEGRDIEDLVASGLRSVDNELLGNLLGLATTSLYHMGIKLAYCSIMSSPGGSLADSSSTTLKTR